jgi:hypothetical protein
MASARRLMAWAAMAAGAALLGAYQFIAVYVQPAMSSGIELLIKAPGQSPVTDPNAVVSIHAWLPRPADSRESAPAHETVPPGRGDHGLSVQSVA